MKTVAVDCGHPDGVICLPNGTVAVYSRYNPECYIQTRGHVHTYKAAPVRWDKNRLAWSEPVFRLPAAGHTTFEIPNPLLRLGNEVFETERSTYRMIVVPAPRMLVEGGESVGVLFPLEDHACWAIRTSYSQPSNARIGVGPKGGWKVLPDFDPPARIRRVPGEYDAHYKSMQQLFIHGWPENDPTQAKRGLDGNIYVVNRNDREGLTNFTVLPTVNGKPAAMGGCTLPLPAEERVTDLDVSPCGTKLALACWVNSGEWRDNVMTVRRTLQLFTIHSPQEVTPLVTYDWPAKYLSFSHDGLTLAFLGVNGEFKFDPVDSVYVVDVE